MSVVLDIAARGRPTSDIIITAAGAQVNRHENVGDGGNDDEDGSEQTDYISASCLSGRGGQCWSRSCARLSSSISSLLMATVSPRFLSTHTSNPFEVSSDNPINSALVRRIAPSLKLEKERGTGEYRSSSAIIEEDGEEEAYTEGTETPHVYDAAVEDEGAEGVMMDEDQGPLEYEDDEDDDGQGSHTEIRIRGLGMDELIDGEEDGQGVAEEDADLVDGTANEEAMVDEDDDTDEERTIYSKKPEERSQIEDEIRDLEQSVPMLKKDYKLLDRLGEGTLFHSRRSRLVRSRHSPGTFSSVYKALDINHTVFYNSPWRGNHPVSSSAFYQSAAPPTKFFVALKRIYVTSSPARIMNEISILEDCRGCRHVAQLITAFRCHDQVVAVMPYFRNEDFRVSSFVVSLYSPSSNDA